MMCHKLDRRGFHLWALALGLAVTVAGSAVWAQTAAVVTPLGQQRRTELQATLDPNRDGWQSEAASDEISRQLSALATALADRSADDLPQLATLLTDDCQSGRLVPERLIDVMHDASVQVQRDADPAETQQLRFNSAPQVREQLVKLQNHFRGLDAPRFTFKIYQVEQDTGSGAVAVSVLFEARGLLAKGTRQWNATWRMRWLPADGNAWRLAGIQIADFEQVTTFVGSPTLLSDQTMSVLGADESFRRQLVHGAGPWMQRLPSYLSPRLLEGHIGLAVGDVNEDGRDDVYVCQPAGLPNRLYLHQPDGTVGDVAARAGVDLLDWCYSALIVDLDNDGHQDLVVMSDGQILIYQGNGRADFRPRARLASSCEYAISAADYDLDGDLDLYACNYSAELNDGLSQLDRTDPLHDSNTGGRNVLFRNEGEWTFVDVTDQVGLDVRNRRWTLAAAWDDFDNDGDPDLYVVNDFGHNNLYRNDDGQFAEIAEQAGVVDANQGMSVSWGDYDRDGWMDLYVSNMFSAAGSRVTSQPNFMPGLAQETKGLYQQLARGNTLLRNQGNGTFRDVSIPAGVTMGRWAWASLFADLNNDGWEDLLVANGYLTQEISDDL
jgi:hypothetical protein